MIWMVLRIRCLHRSWRSTWERISGPFTQVIDNVLSVDFIRAIEEGTAKWNNEEPMRIELEKGNQGTTYLRLKRYELYPFQESQQNGFSLAPAPSG